jgi:hypothetical protein
MEFRRVSIRSQEQTPATAIPFSCLPFYFFRFSLSNIHFSFSLFTLHFLCQGLNPLPTPAPIQGLLISRFASAFAFAFFHFSFFTLHLTTCIPIAQCRHLRLSQYFFFRCNIAWVCPASAAFQPHWLQAVITAFFSGGSSSSRRRA